MTTLKQNVFANYLGQGWRVLAGILFIPFYIDILGMESYALIGIFGLLSAWLTLFDVGMSPALNREMARFRAGAHTPQSIHNLLRSLELLCCGVALLVGLGVWLASGYLATRWLKVDKVPILIVVQCLSIMSVALSMRFLESLYRSALFGLGQQVWLNGVGLVLDTLRHGGVLLVLAWVSPSIQTFFWWQLALSFFSLFLFRFRVHQQLPDPPSMPRFSIQELRQVWQFAGGMLGLYLLTLALTQLDKAILSAMLPLEMFGYYTLATTIANLVSTATIPLSIAVYPRMVELYVKKNDEEFISLYHKAAQTVSVLLMPCGFLLYFWGDGIIYMWSGKVQIVQQTYSLLSVLLWGTLIRSLMEIPLQCTLAHGWTSLHIRINAVLVCLLGPLMFLIVPQYGALGAAWIWCLLSVGYMIAIIHLMHRKIWPNQKWRWYFFDVLLPALGALLVVPVAWWLRPIGDVSRARWFFFYSFCRN